MNPVQGQVAGAVLTLDGEVVRGGLPEKDDARLLYQMLLETSSLNKPIRRLTVSFPSVKYTVARDDSHVYIVQSQ